MKSFAILPAAGSHRRMGQPKLLLPWGEGTVLEAVIRAWQEGGVGETIVVVRPNDNDLARVAAGRGCRVVAPTIPLPEMKDSVAAGLAYVLTEFAPADNDVWLVAPADLPRLSSAVVSRLLNEGRLRPGQIMVPVCGGRRGHPVLFPWSLAAEVARLGPLEGINALLRAQAVCELASGPEALPRDCDTPADFLRLREGND